MSEIFSFQWTTYFLWTVSAPSRLSTAIALISRWAVAWIRYRGDFFKVYTLVPKEILSFGILIQLSLEWCMAILSLFPLPPALSSPPPSPQKEVAWSLAVISSNDLHESGNIFHFFFCLFRHSSKKPNTKLCHRQAGTFYTTTHIFQGQEIFLKIPSYNYRILFKPKISSLGFLMIMWRC